MENKLLTDEKVKKKSPAKTEGNGENGPCFENQIYQRRKTLKSMKTEVKMKLDN